MERKNTHSTIRDASLLRSESRSTATTSFEFVLQWGKRKRLRCTKVHVKDHNINNNPTGSSQEAAHRVTARINRRIGRPDLNNSISKDRIPNQQNNNNNNVIKSNGGGTGYLNLRQRPASPSHRILR